MTVQVRAYEDRDFEALFALVVPYFQDDLKVDLEAYKLRRVAAQMADLTDLDLAWLLMLEVRIDDAWTIVGFCEGQIDHSMSDWNYRPGEAFIRETYVAPPWRGHGFSRLLVEAMETRFREAGYGSVYLTTEGAEAIWVKLGYTLTNEICPLNDGKIMTKQFDPASMEEFDKL